MADRRLVGDQPHASGLGRQSGRHAQPGVLRTARAAFANTSSELARWLRRVATENADLLPWGMSVTSIKSTWDDGWPMLAADVAGLVRAADRFQAAADRFAARKGAILTSRHATVNKRLLKVVEDIDADLTGLSAWEETVYPHQQVPWDVLSLNATLTELERSTPAARRGPQGARQCGHDRLRPRVQS